MRNGELQLVSWRGCLSCSNMALPVSENLVIKQQKPWLHALEPSYTLAYMRRLERRSSMNGEWCLPAFTADCEIVTASPLWKGTEGITQIERQERLWQNFALDPAQWWDYRPDKVSPRHPDFRHKISKEALWINNRSKASWADSLLAIWDTKVGVLTKTCEEGEPREAVEALDVLVQRGCQINDSLLYLVLKRCMAEQDLVLGTRVHALAVKSGYVSNAFLANHVIRMYASHGRLEEARQAFIKVAAPNAYMWATIILAHARQGQPTEAMKFYLEMRESPVKPDNHVFVAVLKACASAKDLTFGKEVHADIQGSGVEPDIVLGNCLVDMYAKCGSLGPARRVFDHLGSRDVVTWTTMIAGYAQYGLGHEALALYESMQQSGMTPPNHVTFVCLLQACTSVGALHQGRRLHELIQLRGIDTEVVVGGSLVDMYAKCGSLREARTVFDSLPRKNVVTWNAMIAGYAKHGLGQEALAVYASMQQDGMTPANHVIFMSLLQACASIGALQQGKQLHAEIQKQGFATDVVVGSCLVTMYAKCGSMEDARKVFDKLPERDVVTWNAMLTGYAEHALDHEALALHASMQCEAISPTDHTFVCLLKACASVGAICEGKELHRQIQERGLEANMFVGNCLVDMYAKCGSLEDARKVFDRLPARDVVTWTALLNGYTEHCDGTMAMQCFEEMLQQGVKPNDTTFICLLVAFSHSGMVHEGQRYFKLMVEHHGIVPKDYHYNCMVDLLGRSGFLDEAENMLLTMPLENTAVGWTSLLSACKSQGDVERGRRCFNHLISLEPGYASSYLLLASIYANAGSWRDVAEVEKLRKSAGAWKKPARACIEVKKKVHIFTVGETRSDISSRLRRMNSRVREEGGHVPQTELVLKALSEQKKEDALCGHAEKLALAYGLLNTPNFTTLLVTKNLRMCGDCHSSTKIIARLEKREIIVKDAHCVHHFVDGSCSCGDRY